MESLLFTMPLRVRPFRSPIGGIGGWFEWFNGLGIHVDCVKILLNANCKLDFRDNLNRIPLDVADEVDKKLDEPRKTHLNQIRTLLTSK